MTSECILHVGSRNPKGYGYSWVGAIGRKVLMHRWAYCQANGLSLDAIAGLVVRHTCDNPPCVNPAHLLIGTQADNIQDMHHRGRERKATGVNNAATKLTPDRVASIRRRYVKGSRHCNLVTLAAEYGVYASTIAAVIHQEYHRSIR